MDGPVWQFITFWIKIAAASIIVGAGLSALDMSAADILARIGMTPDRVMDLTMQGISWALPNLVLGSMVILPLWCLAYVLRPPRG